MEIEDAYFRDMDVHESMRVDIHAEAQISWHRHFAPLFVSGLNKLGIPASICSVRERRGDALPILLGTTFWGCIERDGGDYLLVDRACFKNPEYVRLVLNGHRLDGDHRVPEDYDDSRWNALSIELQPMRQEGTHIICGQDQAMCNVDLSAWFNDVIAADPLVSGFKPHPRVGKTYTLLPLTDSLDGVYLAHVWNSSVIFDCLRLGVWVNVGDPQSLYWALGRNPDREQLCAYLAWTQWNREEIEGGVHIRHLFG